MVVGVDGSASSADALSWSVAEAARRGLSVRVVAVVSSLRERPSQDALAALEESTRGLVDRLAEGSGVEIETRVVVGKPAETLCIESATAAMVVVGSRGLTRFDDLLIGSVAVQVATHAAGPVVVVRSVDGHVEPADSAGRVVVGVDGAEVSAPAVAFAFEEAAVRDVGLTAVYVVRDPAAVLPEAMPLPRLHPDDVRLDAERVLSEALAGWGEWYPQVEVRRMGVAGIASEVLVRESAGAELVVVGSRGSGGFRGLLLGSVSQAVLHHAHCPVAVVRATDD